MSNSDRHMPIFNVGSRFKTQQALYKIIEKLGEGGNSIVYLVIQYDGECKGLLFAMKIFVNLDKPDRRARFDVEVEFLRGTNYPAILQVHDSGYFTDPAGHQDKEFPYVITEYLPQTLRMKMQTGMGMAEKLGCSIQLLSALIYLERRTPAITHRDIKPENIFIRGRSCVLGDFGLLKEIAPPAGGSGEDQHASGVGGGDARFSIDESSGVRFPYLYPTPDLLEYCRDSSGQYVLTPKSDVFQLGLVFAEIFTGQLPLASRAKPYDPVIIESLAPIVGGRAISTAISSLIEKMLIDDPQRRPSASDLFDQWEGLFTEAASEAIKLNGYVFG